MECKEKEEEEEEPLPSISRTSEALKERASQPHTVRKAGQVREVCLPGEKYL
jgi:hypothetical protein